MDELVKFKLYEQKPVVNRIAYESTAYYAGLAKGDLKMFEITEGGPKLIC